VQQDLDYLEADSLRRQGRLREARPAAERALRADLELAYGYEDPIGFLYAAAVHQWLLDDVPSARRMYREVRMRAPSLYPAYYEEAKLLHAGTAANRAAAAHLLWTFIHCFPKAPTLPHARATAAEWHLRDPGHVDCPAQ
jgi:hypothetical protein